MMRQRRERGIRVLLSCVLLAGALAAAGCGPRVDVKQALQVTDVSTGWFDAGLVEGQKNKLVPRVQFRVKNVSNETVSSVQLNAVFRVIGDVQELGSMFVKGIDSTGLAPGQSTELYSLQSALGYTGEQPRLEMLQHGQFKDAQVEIFAKPVSGQWIKLAEHKVDRQLLTQ
jgi:hypothetical protein